MFAAGSMGPVLVHALCIRPYSHSLSDDEKLYKTKAEREAEAVRDPLVRYPEWLLPKGILDRKVWKSSPMRWIRRSRRRPIGS